MKNDRVLRARYVKQLKNARYKQRQRLGEQVPCPSYKGRILTRAHQMSQCGSVLTSEDKDFAILATLDKDYFVAKEGKSLANISDADLRSESLEFQRTLTSKIHIRSET